MAVPFLDRLGTFIITANRLLFRLAVLATGVMVLPTVAEVLTRAFSSSSLPGVIEIVETLMLVLIFASLGFIQDARAHLRVEIIHDRLPGRWRDGLDFGGNLASLLFYGLMAWGMAGMGLERLKSGETTFMLGIPVGWLLFFGVAGVLSMALSLLSQSLAQLVTLLRRDKRFALVMGLVTAALLLSLPLVLTPLFADGDHPMAAGAGGMALLFVLLATGLPIGTVMCMVGYIGMAVVYTDLGSAGSMLGISSYSSAANYNYAVIPMFILMGELALCAGISTDLFRAASLWLGRLPGGLAVATVAGCAGFAAVSGDSMATAVTMTAVALPEMERHHYDPGLACATLAAGGTLGILIPPSTGFIFYSLVTEESVGKLFLAGIIPGLLLTLLFIVILLLFALRHPELAPRGRKAPLRERLDSLWGILPMLALIALIIGGLLKGWFSPNEGGAIGAAGTALYAMVRGRLTRAQLFRALSSTAMVTARLMLILIGVGLLSSFLAATALPEGLAALLTGIQAPRMAVFACIVLFYMLLGCVMNVVPMILLTLPTLYPAVMALGFDSLWFGVIVVIMMEMGQITPPVGLNVYALAAAARHVPMPDIFRRIVPFFLAMLLLVILLALCPGLATWLPTRLFSG